MDTTQVQPDVSSDATAKPIDAPLALQWPTRPVTRPPGQLRRTRRSSIPLFAAGAADSYRTRWLDIQTTFVDEPERSVEQADLLVAEVIGDLARTFAAKRWKLEQEQAPGDDSSTEDLRMAFRRYRSFFDRLLTI